LRGCHVVPPVVVAGSFRLGISPERYTHERHPRKS
jgi:hypothetical protein